jgi:hypothetical protein
MDRTEKVPDVFKPHLSMSLPLSRVTLFILLINSSHSRSFSSAKALLKEIVVLITHHTCYHGMWVGNYVENGWKLLFKWSIAYPCVFPKSDLSSSLILKHPQVNTSSLIFINPLQKWDSYGWACTWVSAFEWRYLFLSKFCQCLLY